jgi:hypothetical protein
MTRPTIAGISTRVSVQTTAMSFCLASSGKDRIVSNTSDATMVLSLPPLYPTTQGRLSAKYSLRSESMIFEIMNRIGRLVGLARKRLPARSEILGKPTCPVTVHKLFYVISHDFTVCPVKSRLP